MKEAQPLRHLSVKKEPKFCRCRLCHEHFYAETIDKAKEKCLQHAALEHPKWGGGACYCPD